jgi:FAD/FMN-containing dehydrogenase
VTRTPSRAPDGFYHPATEDQIIELVRLARARRCALRVRGSAHSIPAAIHTDAHLDGRALAIDVMLDRFRRVEIDEVRGIAVVEAGCHLGIDPQDPTGTSTWEGSLLAQLDARGWALPDLGGVTHQTVSGFLLTGSSGGSVQHAVEDAVLAVRFVDGEGRVHDAVRDEPDLFDAVVTSMGLLGVVTRVTLRCVRRYDVIGLESITHQDGAAYDPFAEGERGLAAFLRRTEYARLMWWPQRKVERLVTWQGRRMRAGDYDAETAPGGTLRAKAYQVIGDSVPDPRLARPLSLAAQKVCGAFYDGVDAIAAGYARAEQRAPLLAPFGRRAAAGFARAILPPVLKTFVPLDPGAPQRFWGPWHEVLPMDNPMSEESLPTTFTEIWIPLGDAAQALRALRDHFERGGLAATGSYIFELYAARATRGWLHPGYGRDSLRVDVFWFSRNRKSPIPFFNQFWDLLAPYGYRLHWGKHLPADDARGARYLRAQYPRWDDFLRLRAELDPMGIFLNRHFQRALGIPAPEVAWPPAEAKTCALPLADAAARPHRLVPSRPFL